MQSFRQILDIPISHFYSIHSTNSKRKGWTFAGEGLASLTSVRQVSKHKLPYAAKSLLQTRWR